MEEFVNLKAQSMYDDALAIAEAWKVFAEVLASKGVVCRHPERYREPMKPLKGDSGEEGELCHSCGTILRMPT